MALMLGTAGSVAIFLLFLSVPVLTIYGWVVWARSKHTKTFLSTSSLISFSFATTSSLLAISSLLYSLAIGGFPYHNLLLFRIYGVGSLLSLGAIIFAAMGMWRANPLRWYAVVCSAGTLVFWIFSAAGE